MKKILEIIKIIFLNKHKKCKAKTNLKNQKEPELVDLGLPSGNLWMKYNLGASKEYEYGYYFQWGSLKGYSRDEALKHSTWKTSPFNNDGKNTFDEKYFKVNRHKWIYKSGILKSEFDIVTQTYGEEYKIPEPKDFKELLDNTIITLNYKFLSKGILFTSKINGNTIFMPFSGYVSDGYFHGFGYFSNLWLSTRCCTDSLSAFHMYCHDSNSCSINLGNQFSGMPIRGIKVKRD